MDKHVDEKSAANPMLGDGLTLENGGKANSSDIHVDSSHRKESARRTQWRHAWHQYCQETSLHGLRQITEPQPFCIRRVFWLLVVLVGAGLFVVQMWQAIAYYYASPVNVNIKINYNESITFPAVTICNQNSFRTTVAAARGRYHLLSDLFRHSKHSHAQEDQVLLSLLTDTRYNASEISLDEIYNSSAHVKEDFIVKCLWDGEPCSSDDFIPRPTDFGICYTFNSGPYSDVRKADKTGTQGGLQIQLNVEQYEYMAGPNDGAGIKLLVHSQKQIPRMKEFGIAMPPGSHSYIGMTYIQIQNLPSPHGECLEEVSLTYYDHYTQQNCQEDCKQRFVQNQCGCRDLYMPRGHGSDVFPVCSLTASFMCLQEAVDAFNDYQPNCNCPIPCMMESYATRSSFSFISDFDADALLHSNLTSQLQDKYVTALEVQQRVIADIVQKDSDVIQGFLEIVGKIDDTIASVMRSLTSATLTLEEMTASLTTRLKMHRKRALEKVLFIAKHDFVRGWQIIEERCLPFVCFAYKTTRSRMRKVMETVRETRVAQPAAALAVWSLTKNGLQGQLELVDRVRDNLTEIQTGYKSGKPLLTYKASKDRRYDMSYISVDLLQAKVDSDMHDQDEFYAEIMTRLDSFEEAISEYIDMGERCYADGEQDEERFATVSKRYDRACTNYIYNIFLYKTRIVNAPVEVMEERIEVFDRINMSLAESAHNLKLVVHSVNTSVAEALNGSWAKMRGIAFDALEYLTDASVQKMDLARKVSSHEMQEYFNDVELFFTDLRSRGRDFHDRLQDLSLKIENTWNNMLSEYPTYNFYAKLNEDFEDFVANPNRTDFYIPYFAYLLGWSQSRTRGLDIAELELRLNADFHTMNRKEKRLETQVFFEKLAVRTNVAKQMSSIDEEFKEMAWTLRNTLGSYQQSGRVDTHFYLNNFMKMDIYMQELSYEEIVQQPAYDSVQLLGDIGGSFGLFLGASALTVIEIFDILVHQFFRYVLRK